MIKAIKTTQGLFHVEASERGVSALYFPGEKREEASLKEGGSLARAHAEKAKSVLIDYFKGKPAAFNSIKYDLSAFTPFQVKVLKELQKVGPGKTSTYGELAKKAGSPRAARAVGSVMNKNRVPILLPCHRIVGSSGSLTGYAKGLGWKRKLLSIEGAHF